jgi:hypothetical protein
MLTKDQTTYLLANGFTKEGLQEIATDLDKAGPEHWRAFLAAYFPPAPREVQARRISTPYR